MSFSTPTSVTNAQGYTLSFDPQLLQPEVIHGFLTQTYWAKGIPPETVARALAHSLCVGIYKEQQQVAFARLITDYTTFAYLADVFVLPQHRGLGLSKWLVQALRAHPQVQGLRRWMLGTQDAHGLYAQFGFEPLPQPDRFMQIHTPSVYQTQQD